MEATPNERDTDIQEEASEACRFIRKEYSMKDGDFAMHSYYRPVKPVIQKGPQCGLVVSSMASDLLGVSCPVDVLYAAAREKGITKSGEMFSALGHLLRELCGLTCDLVRVTEGAHCAIIAHLRAGRPVLIPYDKDFSGDPCCRGGVRAHWALLTGVVLVTQITPQDPILRTQDSNVHFLHMQHELTTEMRSDVIAVYVYARHGNTKYPRVWELSELLTSNLQLHTMDPKVSSQPDQFHWPTEGMDALRGQALLLRKES